MLRLWKTTIVNSKYLTRCRTSPSMTLLHMMLSLVQGQSLITLILLYVMTIFKTIFQSLDPFHSNLELQAELKWEESKTNFHWPLLHAVNRVTDYPFTLYQQALQSRPGPLLLSCPSVEFTKTWAPFVHLLRSRGIRVHVYLDDWIIWADSESQASLHAQEFWTVSNPLDGISTDRNVYLKCHRKKHSWEWGWGWVGVDWVRMAGPGSPPLFLKAIELYDQALNFNLIVLIPTHLSEPVTWGQPLSLASANPAQWNGDFRNQT